MLSPARIATLAAIIVIGALTVFALFERDQSGLTRATLHPAMAESNWLFTVTAAPPDDSLHAGDTVAIDDPLTLAAYNLHALPVRAPLIVRRIAPPPQVEVNESLKPLPQESFRFVIFALQLLFLMVAALVAARGGRTGRDGSLSLAWLLALIPCLMNPTTATWPRPLVFIYAVIGGALAVTARRPRSTETIRPSCACSRPGTWSTWMRWIPTSMVTSHFRCLLETALPDSSPAVTRSTAWPRMPRTK